MEGWSCASPGAARVPYSLFFKVNTDEVVILAVAHHSRRPGYWIDRMR
jgi:hypothetical protein